MRSIRKLAIMLLLLSTALFADVEVKRGQFWGRVTYAPKLEKGIGFMISAGMRDNFSITKEVNGVEKESQKQEFWLKELMIGPTHSMKIGKKLSLQNQLLYRPQLWYPDNNGGVNYLRHTLMANSNLFHSLGKLKIHYRLSFWNQFEAIQHSTNSKVMDNELYVRIMAGPVVPLGKRVSLFSKIEPFLKVTVSDTDVDGTEFMNKVVSWNGINIKATPDFTLSMQYVHMSSFPSETLTVRDNYLYLHMIYAPSPKSKGK